MLTHTYAGIAVNVNEQGYLTESSQWSHNVAAAIAEELNIELTTEHWRVIDFAREDYSSSGKSPGLRRISKKGGVPTKELYSLFPRGPGKLIARVAGLPKPKSCL